MRIMIFDTETVSLNKPFCYNIGYVIYDTKSHKTLVSKDFVVEQIWHNLSLFSTAYYADKRPIYVNRMKAKKVKMTKYGQVMRAMRADIKNFNVEIAYAYNSSFDERVFEFNCDWYKVSNPLDTIPVIDIRPFAFNSMCQTRAYKEFCEKHENFTDSGNYSTTAESVFQFLTQNPNFVEEHTALNDSEIETGILVYCMNNGIDITKPQNCGRSIPRQVDKHLTIVDSNKNVVANYYCSGYTVSKKYDKIYLKGF